MTELMSVKQVASRFSVTVRTMGNWITEGKIPPPCFGGGRGSKRQWRRSVIEAFINKEPEAGNE
ncbi:helix-turn-helix transcriptional regulator [Vibrio harveyi]|uniref:helix-turn-helix transcriptional regulator n=1 Tax=Vibrio harveyi TaxID=669 RepID=UPI000D783007|nr:helix-turn-helix domain-containing protein [Vibrio harveyi]GBK97719.1 hypothetical protein VH1709_contig00011-0047 [Vibrio harveyi]HDM8061674.1 helix-turn-helix domain-containing protein [Vibrio harveyi]